MGVERQSGSCESSEKGMSSMVLEGRHAIVTGANRGLGSHIARHFVRAGAEVLICGRNAELVDKTVSELKKDSGRKVIGIAADVSSENDANRILQTAESEFPCVDILVNCAGICGPVGPVETLDWKEWKQALDINVGGTVLMCMRVLPHMKSRRYGKIINISGGGATKPLPHLSAYAASKAGAVRFTETLALEVKKFGIDVNAIAPGVLNTGLVDEFVRAGVENLGEDYFREVERQKKSGTDSFARAASLAVYLASQKSDGITGRLISAVWDPWENLEEHADDLAASDIYTIRRINPADRGRHWGKRK